MIKILVIEDDEMIRANILEILEAQQNFNVLDAENGRLGLFLAQENKPDLILCDVLMPELNGYEVLTALRQDPQTAVIPFIFLTALADHTNTRKGMELGADDYLIKPCKPLELLKAITTRLEKQTAITKTYTDALQEASDQLNQSLYYDSLTKLPNRLLLEERLNQFLNQALSQKINPVLSLLYFSFDRFNRLIETWGYGTTDLLIKTAVQRLQKSLDPRYILARLSTKEFAILVPSVNENETLSQTAQNILDNISQLIEMENNNEVLLTASLGIAIYPNDGENLENLLQSAHKAMSHAKHQGRNSYIFYQAKAETITAEDIALEISLSHALERQELELYYQPKVSLKTGKIVGAEALLRWHNPARGFISPAKFIPIAEETSLIIPIGQWVLKTACQQTKLWHQSGFSDLRIAVNLSGRQFNQPHLYSQLSQILTDCDFDAKYLELELTESILVENPEISVKKLMACKDLGLQISVDDFGTGYSSLSYLQKFPFDILKIDQSFIRQMNQDPKTKTITKYIIKMGHELNLRLVAEGVETTTELELLQENNCDEIQGYLFSKPVKSEDFYQLLRQDKCLDNIKNQSRK